MPISLKEYTNIKEKKLVNNEALLDFMRFETEYTTPDIRRFLQISRNAVIQRLRDLEKKGYVSSRQHRHVFIWKKMRDYDG